MANSFLKGVNSERSDLPYLKQLIVDIIPELDLMAHSELKGKFLALLRQPSPLLTEGNAEESATPNVEAVASGSSTLIDQVIIAVLFFIVHQIIFSYFSLG